MDLVRTDFWEVLGSQHTDHLKNISNNDNVNNFLRLKGSHL